MALFNDSTSPVRRHSEVVFWCFALFMLLICLGHNALWGLEGRCAEVVREMLLSMDFFHPEINGVLQTGRPPLSYWATLPAAVLFGTDEFTLRLPAVAAAVVLLVTTRMTAKKLFEEQTALVAMWVLFSTYGFLFWGRVAAPDMANAAAVSCAVTVFLYWDEKPSFSDYLFFYLMLALGTLFKGVPMVAVVLLLILPVAVVRGNLKHCISIRSVLALLVGVAVGLLPYLCTQVADGSAVTRAAANGGFEAFWSSQVLRILDARYSGEPVYSYIYHLPRIIFPWSAVFIIGVAGFIQIRKELPKEFSALLFGMLMAFGLFSVSGSRRWYYLLPLVPFCAITSAAALCSWGDKLKAVDWVVTLMRGLILVVSAVAFAVPVLLPLQRVILNYTIPGGVFVCCCAAGLISLLVYTCDQGKDNAVAGFFGMPHRIASLVVCTAVIFSTVMAAVIPQFTIYRTEKHFVTGLQKQLDGIEPENIFIYGSSVNGRILYYLNQVRPVENSTDLAGFLADNTSQRVAVICVNKAEELKQVEAELDKLNAAPFDPSKPFLTEQRLPHESSGKDKLAAWIFDVPEGLLLK